MIAVLVNGHPLHATALVERGRLFLPLRATAVALGAQITYDPRTREVVVTRFGRSIALHPKIVRQRSYAPLRVVAQALGARVGYRARSKTVSVSIPVAAADARLPGPVRIASLTPPNGARVSTAYPAISASIQNALASRSSVRLLIDGQDVTAESTFDGSTITYLPRSGLQPGTHVALFSGVTQTSRAFSQAWSFTTTLPAPPDMPSGYYDGYDYAFYVDGRDWFSVGDWMQFTLIAPPGGSAYLHLCGLRYTYPFWNAGDGTRYEANIPAPYGYWESECPVYAWYTTWDGREIEVPYPVYISLYTLTRRPRYPVPNPRATPITHPIGLPTGEPRRPEPTPSPPRRIVHPIVRRTPGPLRTLRPLPTPASLPTPVSLPAPRPVTRPERTPVPRAPVPRAPHPRPRPT